MRRNPRAVTAFNVRQHLSAASLARIDATLEAAPGRYVPRKGVYIPFDVTTKMRAVEFEAIDSLPGHLRKAWHEHGRDAVTKTRECCQAVAKVKKRKSYREAMAAVAEVNARTGMRFTVFANW